LPPARDFCKGNWQVERALADALQAAQLKHPRAFPVRDSTPGLLALTPLERAFFSPEPLSPEPLSPEPLSP